MKRSLACVTALALFATSALAKPPVSTTGVLMGHVSAPVSIAFRTFQFTPITASTGTIPIPASAQATDHCFFAIANISGTTGLTLTPAGPTTPTAVLGTPIAMNGSLNSETWYLFEMDVAVGDLGTSLSLASGGSANLVYIGCYSGAHHVKYRDNRSVAASPVVLPNAGYTPTAGAQTVDVLGYRAGAIQTFTNPTATFTYRTNTTFSGTAFEGMALADTVAGGVPDGASYSFGLSGSIVNIKALGLEVTP